jgi:hypothetical protein
MASFAVFKTPRGVFRLLELLFAIISFGAMADVSMFDREDDYRFLVGMGVLAFMYAFIISLIYIFQQRVDNCCLWTPVFELCADGLLTILLFAAFVASAVKCNKNLAASGSGMTVTWCDDSKDKDNVKASIAFTFINFVTFVCSTWFSYKLNVEEEKKPDSTPSSA